MKRKFAMPAGPGTNMTVHEDDGPGEQKVRREDEDDSKFERREYQIDMANTAVERNTIIYLPTGSGKTYISILVIRRFHEAVKRAFEDGGKRIIFTAPKVALVDQQAEFLRKHTPFTVGAYNGYMQVEYWERDKWHEEIVKNQVLVMGSQILLDILDKGFLKMSQMALLVFDECHHATGNHPMNMTMVLHYKQKNPPMPRILGLTATSIKKNVLPQKLATEIASLESNLQSKLVKLSSLELIKGMYADPNVEVVLCPQIEPPAILEVVKMLIAKLEEDMKVEAIEAASQIPPTSQKLAEGELMIKPGAYARKVQRQLTDIMLEIKEFGIFGGTFAIQCHRNRLQCLASVADSQDARQFYMMVVSQLEVIRHLLESYMKKKTDDVLKQIELFSSAKVLKCIEKLRAAVQGNEDSRSLIFVERRMSARVLYTIIKILSLKDPDFCKVKPDYVVGQEDGSYCSKMAQFTDKMTKKSIFNFFTGKINLMVASSVMEEGIDIPTCNLVIKFDEIKTFCSFIQSKGRARDKNSKYILLIDETSKFPANRDNYSLMENLMQLMQLDGQPEEIDSGILNTFITPAGAKATSENAISLLYRYFNTFGSDRFSSPAPLWFCQKINETDKFVSVVLPMQSTLIDPIKGPIRTRVVEAKKECALEAIKKLHAAGQLDDNLKSNFAKIKKDLLADPELFPTWNANDVTDAELGYPGTKTRRRLHQLKPPSWLIDCGPKPDSVIYMYSIEITPKYEVKEDDQRRSTFLKLLSGKNENFAILTSKPWPKTCDFPIFTNAGKINVSIGRIWNTLTVSSATLAEIRAYHSTLFGKVLNLDKSFLAWDFTSGLLNCLIAPVTEGFALDTRILKKDFAKNYDLEVIENYNDLRLKVIVPTYRTKSFGNYIVTEVQFDNNPMSEFPNDCYGTYSRYYRDKWDVVVKNMTQPLVSVKQITENINFLNPRGEIVLITRKAMHENAEFAETFIPELCKLSGHNHLVSSEMWLKAVLLPSILHRATILLHAEDLRSTINKECNIGTAAVEKWKDFVAESKSKAPEQEKKPEMQGFGLPKLSCNVPRVNERTCSWGQEEPIDPDKFLYEGVSWGQLEEFALFTQETAFLEDIPSAETQYTYKRDNTIAIVPINLLTPNDETAKIGPELSTMYSAITTTSANDSVNMERLETLGDSFLKFITTLYLFCTYEFNEGILTTAKGKLVGNRNLYYCALKKGLASILNNKQFAPKSDWAVPNLSVPRVLQYLLVKAEVGPGVLNGITLTAKEKATGEIADIGRFMEILESYEDDDQVETTMVSFLNQQLLSDKCLADCVEAILGAYVEACGPLAAASVVSWFQILPESAKTVMTDPTPSNIMNTNVTNAEKEVNAHICEAEKLEATLGYKFKQRSLLLEALTHPSYVSNRLTNSNQRLEFLGDAVLDFLITAHIYEKFSKLTPGEMTDLRSALVNNVTFASLAVRYGFHTFILANSQSVITAIDNFVDFQQKNGHKISDDHLLLIQEDNVNVGIALEVPKLLGDIFESIIGAVFLDCGKNLVTTWEVVYPLMKYEIDLFGTTVPKNAVRKLYESVPKSDLVIGKPTSLDGVDGVQVKIVISKDEKTLSCIGTGTNKHEAKRAAAKGALRLLLQS